MVGGITTVTIETVIFGKRYLFLAHDEKIISRVQKYVRKL